MYSALGWGVVHVRRYEKADVDGIWRFSIMVSGWGLIIDHSQETNFAWLYRPDVAAVSIGVEVRINNLGVHTSRHLM